MTRLRKIYAFSSGSKGGNPAGVVLDADSLSEEQMQAIASRAGFPETAFVSCSSTAGYKLDFFTPTTRIADCGHATVAAFSLLRQRQPGLQESSKELANGQTRRIFFEGERTFMEQPRAKITPVTVPLKQLFSGVSAAARGSWIAAHDVRFLLIELEETPELQQAVPDLEAIKAYSDQQNVIGIYLFVRGGKTAATTRMFAPLIGINEEAATGMAAGLLSAYLAESAELTEFTIEQGVYMTPASPSLLYCRVEKTRVLVGGTAHER